MINTKEYKCLFCDKLYSSYKSLWDHNKKFHKDNNINNNEDNINNKKIIKCENCNKIFSSRYTKYEHKKKVCNKKNNCTEIEELKEMLNKKLKIHPKTLQKINKELSNINITNNNIINNNINININNTINKTYNYNMLSKEEITNILSKAFKSLEESIKTIHFNEKIS